jgi:hypothetical protein
MRQASIRVSGESLIREHPLNPAHANFRSLHQFAFPDPQHPPTAAAQGSRHELIPTFVAGKFPLPERAIVLWLRRVLWATVPETTIHKHRHAMLPKDKVWRDGELMVLG